MAAKLIPVSVWAENIFGEHRPHRNTLLNWVKSGKIAPQPTKVGRTFFCKPDAQYVDAHANRMEMLLNGR